MFVVKAPAIDHIVVGRKQHDDALTPYESGWSS